VEFPTTELIYTCHTEFQTIEVSENTEVRLLRTDKRAIQSALLHSNPSRLVLPSMQAMMMMLLFQTPPKRILLFGLGGGDMVRQLHFQLPESTITAVEIDPAIVAVSRDYFALPDSANIHIHTGDAAHFVRNNIQGYHTTIIDIYSGETPSELLASKAFYHSCYQQLEDDGMLILNVISNDADTFKHILQMIRQQFNHLTLCLSVPDHLNIIVFAFKQRPAQLSRPALLEKATLLQQQFGLELQPWTRQLFANNPTADGELIF